MVITATRINVQHDFFEEKKEAQSSQISYSSNIFEKKEEKKFA